MSWERMSVVGIEQRGGGLTLGVIGQGALLLSIQLGSLWLSRALGEQRTLFSNWLVSWECRCAGPGTRGPAPAV
jgi:hypothetical protein